MPTRFLTVGQGDSFRNVVAELERIGYRGDLLQSDYVFPDYFQAGTPERAIPIAAFGQTPQSYETACFGVLVAGANGSQNGSLVLQHRALGAPMLLELDADHVSLWSVGASPDATKQQARIPARNVVQFMRSRTDIWAPTAVLRAKHISAGAAPRQLDFFDLGLIPALEGQIQEKIVPVLHGAISAAARTYFDDTGAEPDAKELFRLALRMLAGKIFYDRRVPDFITLGPDPGPSLMLRAVANHFSIREGKLLSAAARHAMYDSMWTRLDFRNISIAVLTHVWATTLVTDDVRRANGIHATPRPITRYILDRLPFDSYTWDRKTYGLVLEPCAGSATFLIAALQRIRDLLPPGISEKTRHTFFQNVLVGFERETFGVEVGRLCLTLADFPNPNGWELYEKDIFLSEEFQAKLADARVVLCNPPFEDFHLSDPIRQRLPTPHQPVEILRLVLAHLHPSGILGFVLPRQFLDGGWYRDVRRDVARRFADVEIVSLPDVAFKPAQHETVLLLATNPRASGDTVTVRHRKVAKKDWQQFVRLQAPGSEDVTELSVDQAARGIAVPDLLDVWKFLADAPKLEAQIQEVHRGIEWKHKLVIRGKETGARDKLVLDVPAQGCPKGYRLGIPPKAKPCHIFECPSVKCLSVRAEDVRRGFDNPWDRPKVIMNAKRKSRGPWRVAAFADLDGLVFYQTFTGVWTEESMAPIVAAVLNGPVANAYIATREGSDITNETLNSIPMPRLTEAQNDRLEKLIRDYVRAVAAVQTNFAEGWSRADHLLRQIDATVLSGYGLPPVLERKLLDYFRNSERAVPFMFADYFPVGFRPCLSLAYYISPEYRRSTAGALRERWQPAPEDVTQALKLAIDAHSE